MMIPEQVQQEQVLKYSFHEERNEDSYQLRLLYVLMES
jgi:hypothetical protein